MIATNNIKFSVTVLLLWLGCAMLSCRNPVSGNYTTEVSDSIVRLAVLFSKTGKHSITELSMRDAAAFAVEEINNDGGVLGKQIELVDIDAESDDQMYKGSSVQLINKYRVSAIFCNLPLTSQNYVVPKLKKASSLLFDLSDYTSTPVKTTDIINLGSSPNQLLYPGVEYLVSLPKQPYKKFFLLGSDNEYSRTANKLLKSFLLRQGTGIHNIKEHTVTSSGNDMTEVILNIKRFATDGNACVLNTIRGDLNINFYKEFANQGLSSLGCPIMSFTISEDELRQMGAEFIIGHLFCRNYFQSVDTDKNIRFISEFKLFCAIQELPEGVDRVTGDAIFRTYTGVYLWKKAVEKAGSFNKEKIKEALMGLEFNSPAGPVKLNKENLTIELPVLVGESTLEGQISVLWSSEEAVPAIIDWRNRGGTPLSSSKADPEEPGLDQPIPLQRERPPKLISDN